MTTSRYKGFRVLARPYQLRECKRWTVDIEIRRNGRCQAFSTNRRYHTEHEAGAHCFSLARRIIDGAEHQWSVDFLRSPRRNRRLSRTWMAVSVRQLLVAGIVLLVAGGFLLLRGWGFASSGHVPEAGSAEVSTRERRALPPPVSGAAVAAGVVLLVIGVRKRA